METSRRDFIAFVGGDDPEEAPLPRLVNIALIESAEFENGTLTARMASGATQVFHGDVARHMLKLIFGRAVAPDGNPVDSGS